MGDLLLAPTAGCRPSRRQRHQLVNDERRLNAERRAVGKAIAGHREPYDGD